MCPAKICEFYYEKEGEKGTGEQLVVPFKGTGRGFYNSAGGD